MRTVIQLVSALVSVLGLGFIAIGVATMSEGSGGASGAMIGLVGASGIGIGVAALIGGAIAYMLCEIDQRLQNLLERTPALAKSLERTS